MVSAFSLAQSWRRGDAKLISWPWLDETYLVRARARSVRLSFTAGKHLSIYDACRLISGRLPHPPGFEAVPCMALISGGADKLGYHHQRPHARRGRAAFLAIKSSIKAGTIIPTERSYLVPPTATSDGVIDWLNTKVRTSDVVALCAEHRWRVRFEHLRPSPTMPVGVTEPTAATEPSAGAPNRRQFMPLDKPKIIEYFETCSETNGDKAWRAAEKKFGIAVRQVRGRKFWEEAGRWTPRGKRPRLNVKTERKKSLSTF